MPAGASPTPNVYLYRGERYDADLGLYYLRARWYNPLTGRFMTRDPYQGSAYDPASLHRYNYARANPVNFVDPSGRSAAAENALVLSLNSVAEAAGVAALGYEVRCALYAEASAVHLVDEHMDQDITQLGLLMNQCAAQITVGQFARATAGNLLFMGAVGVAGRGIGWLLEGGEQGALVGTELEGATGSSRGIFSTSDGVAANNFKDYENGIREMFTGDQSLVARRFTAEVNGVIQNGVADAVTTINNMPTAIEAKYTANWDESIYNPESPVSSLPFAQGAVQDMVNQAARYSQGFEGGVIYYTNSPALASYYTQAFQQAGITNFQFVITPAIPY